MNENKLTQPQLTFIIKFIEQIDHFQNVFYKGLRNILKNKEFERKFPQLNCYKEKTIDEKKNSDDLYYIFKKDFPKDFRRELNEKEKNRKPNNDEKLLIDNWKYVSHFFQNKNIFWKICCCGFESIPNSIDFSKDLLAVDNLEEFCGDIEKFFEKLNPRKRKDLPNIYFFEKIIRNIDNIQNYFVKGMQNLLEIQTFAKKFPKLCYYKEKEIKKIEDGNFNKSLLSSCFLEQTTNTINMDIYNKNIENFKYFWENRKKIERICKYGFEKKFANSELVISYPPSVLEYDGQGELYNDNKFVEFCSKIDQFFTIIRENINNFFQENNESPNMGLKQIESQEEKNPSMIITGQESLEIYDNSESLSRDKEEIMRLNKIIKKNQEEEERLKKIIGEKDSEIERLKKEKVNLREELKISGLKYEDLKISMEEKIRILMKNK